MQIPFKLNVTQETQSGFVFCLVLLAVCLSSKIFLDPTNANEAQNKMASRSHDCPQWAEADLQPSVSHRKGCRRIESVW